MAEDNNRQIYNPEQVTALLKRAMELQQAGASQDGSGSLSLDEIKQIAADVGISPHYIDAAAATTEPPSSSSGLIGGPTAHELGRVIKGSIDDEAWESMVREARHSFGQAGTLTQFGATREWTTSEREVISMHLAVSSRDGQTRIQLTERFEGATGLYYLAGTTFTAISVAVVAALLPFSPGVEWGLAGGGFIAAVATMRSMFGRWSHKQRGKLTELMRRLEGMVQREGPALHSNATRIAETSE